MEDTRSIVVVGGDDTNMAKLTTQIEPIRLNENKGIAIKSIFHGTVCNIDVHNNKVYYRLNDGESKIDYFEIPEGNYPDSMSILTEISDIISEFEIFASKAKKPRLELSTKPKRNSIEIKAFNISIYLRNMLNITPWGLLGIKNDVDEFTDIEVDRLDFTHHILPSFLYVNIVENSYINGKLSRNLSTVPLSLNRGWSFYEFKNPIYIPVDVKDFSKIVLELRSMSGNLICFQENYKTVITLHLKPINREVN